MRSDKIFDSISAFLLATNRERRRSRARFCLSLSREDIPVPNPLRILLLRRERRPRLRFRLRLRRFLERERFREYRRGMFNNRLKKKLYFLLNCRVLVLYRSEGWVWVVPQTPTKKRYF